MLAIARLTRQSPGLVLKSYLEHKAVPIPEPINWNGENSAILQPLLRAVESLDAKQRELIRDDAERIDKMANEVGQTAIMAIADPTQLMALRTIESRHGRALWLFVNDYAGYVRAEQAAAMDNARLGRNWSGFRASRGLVVLRDIAALHAFKAELLHFFPEGDKVKIEVFDRVRVDINGQPHDLVQVTVYREDMPESPLVFNGDELEPMVYRPVRELAFCYDPESGIIEVVANLKQKRIELAKLFAAKLLGQTITAESVALREFDPSVFMAEKSFPTDPMDGIIDVRPRLVKFRPFDGGSHVTIELQESASIYAESKRLFGDRDPFIVGGYTIREVALSVTFRPDAVNPRGKTLDIKLRAPNGCNIKDKTEKERLIGEKYLRLWGIETGVSHDDA